MSSPSDHLAKPHTYMSGAILERRSKMIAATQKVIAECGFEGFSVRLVCEQAGVSAGTFYNAFSTKENAVAIAVSAFPAQILGPALTQSAETIDDVVRRLVTVQTRIQPHRQYIAATMRVFWSDTLSVAAKGAMTEASLSANRPYLAALERRKMLVPFVDVDELAVMIMVGYYGLLSYWVGGGMPDAALPKAAVESFLNIAAGATRGAAAREIADWRQEIAEGGPRWLAALEVDAAP